MKKFLASLLALSMALSMAACGNKDNGPGKPSGSGNGDPSAIQEGDFTYHTSTTALGTKWNPHTWETNADREINTFLTAPLCTMSVKDSVEGVYQWVWVAATGVKDVTADHQADLTKYAVTLPEGQTAEDTKSGFVYEIKLNPEMKWQDGTPINADTYVYSMQAMLDPSMRNYRANLYYKGESAVAGGLTYYNSGAPIYNPMVPAYEDAKKADYSYDLDAGVKAGEVFINVSTDGMTLTKDSLAALNKKAGLGLDAEVKTLDDAADLYGYTKVTAENLPAVKTLLTAVLNAFGVDAADQANMMKEALFVGKGEKSPIAEYDGTVGCYKVDDYTINYVTQTQIDLNNFLTSLTSSWLVYKDLYEAGKDTTGALVTTNYGTSIATTMSYGPYKLESLQDGKQMVLVQNENYYAYDKTESGYLYSMTDFEVDGEHVQQYQTTKIVIDVMDDDAAKQAFLKGQLSVWTPTADDLPTYATSDYLYKEDDTYTMSFFFNTGLENLQTMDKSKGNTNSVVLSNINFRKAFSLAIDRDEYVGATSGWKPAYELMNTLYHYDIYNDPNSSYRKSDPAMQAICDLYGVKYGEGTPYATLKDAYKSINGYNLTEAQSLMKTACDELVAAGLYKAGEPINIRIGWAKGALTSADNQQLAVINKHLNRAIEGSGFGKITLEAIGNINDRYSDVANGEYAIGYGAWGGAALYPFRNFQVYCDSSLYNLNEAGCWDPAAESLTMEIDGKEVTKTWLDWSNCMIGSGDMANASFETKLQILATMEENFLKFFYRIPLASVTNCTMLSQQCQYYTENYNIMYGFGGFDLLSYNYNDADWASYVSSQGGTLNYE